MTKVAVYDNPDTFCREAWVDGKMTTFVSAHLLESKGFQGGSWFPFELNVGRWDAGMIIGDPEAMEPVKEEV